MVNAYNKKGQLVRWESYERDKDNMMVSKFNNHYAVINFGKKTKTKKKEIAVRTYKVWKDENEEVHCNCPSHNEKDEVCKHMIAVSEKAKEQKRREHWEEHEQEIKAIIARW